MVRKKSPGLLQAAVACGRDFCMETSMNGFNHIAAPGRWWVERVLWACVTAAAIWGAVDISLGQWQRYNENPTVVALEKDFRSWEFCMPGLTVCARNRVDDKKLPSVIKKFWDVDPQDEKYARYESFIRDVANSSLLHMADLLQHEGEDLEVDLYQLVVDVLPEFNLKATWSMASQVPWFPVMTEMGACYATNSLAIPDDAIVRPHANETRMFPLTCKYSSLNCYSTIEVPQAMVFYVHSPYDILNVRSAPFEVRPGVERPTEFSVIESGCGRGVRELSPRRRRCLYTDEGPGRRGYSTNSCRRACRNREALRDCQCKPFYNQNEDGVACSLRGMRCLAARAAHEAARVSSEAERAKVAKHAAVAKVTTVAKEATVAKVAIVDDDADDADDADAKVETKDDCACPLMCVDALFEILSLLTKRLDGPFSTNGVCRIKVQAPRTRYTREIVFYFQDLIVSFGGAAGLFLGASFISFVEILFFCAERLLMGLSAPNKEMKTVQVKKSKVSHEQARIQHLNAILEEQRLPAVPGYWPSYNRI